MSSNERKRNLLSIEDLSSQDVKTIFNFATEFARNMHAHFSNLFQGKVVLNVFFENSTRTLTSFEIAAKRLGAHVVNIQIAHSSINKGETLKDTMLTLNAMEPNFCIIRHNESSSVKLLAQYMSCSVINAGDGSHEHPTQALLDAFTINQKLGNFSDLRIAICGDILHSRVARSNLILFTKLGAHVNLIAPSTLLPSINMQNVSTYTNMKEGMKGCDVVMMLRIQQERMHHSFIPSSSEFFKFYGLNSEKLSYAKKGAMVMHPGPINRGVEIESNIADNVENSLILEQVKNGVFIRQAVFQFLNQ
ncbi:Aspartate carbamoyltransferase [Rickettsiales bacterium Ac37b]|nr:Aspartate carbamoyltransferase [Rickettsiales bacterium Ac37b]